MENDFTQTLLEYAKFNKMDTSLNDQIITITDNVPQKITQRFNDGRVFTVFIHYNKAFENWIVDFYQQSTDGQLVPIVTGILLEWGLDLLMPYRYLNLGEFYVYSKNPSEFDAPTYNDLNLNFIYLWRHS